MISKSCGMQNVYILINLISYVGVVITQLSKTTSFSSNKWNVDIGTRKTLERERVMIDGLKEEGYLNGIKKRGNKPQNQLDCQKVQGSQVIEKDE